ncbi:ABC transporter ATP-binding protein/permease [Longicatena caecimuris]|uniref:ABC transporter ATP-binding protein n=1 Tax=Longicatena caecimuris TaxID=1796635 RepID=UPI001D01578C|nr:ABC transporter ATP-binding protein [Longicatena caecimuris]MCB5393403.1 ABC transporter ATP-binding protein/permease [Longicatena caecimuris]MCB5564358.1 ABC transporter ATP-binding protein/permease [Longicatena caecimuris]
MINKMMKRFALSREGAKGLVVAIAACTFADLVLMFPVGLLYFLVSDFIDGAVPTDRYALYGIGIAAALLLIFLSEFWKYNATYFSTYKESGKCRIRLAEKLRKLPLSFFGKKDLADLTNVMMGDVATTEQMFSHYVPQFYASIISTCIIAISLFFYDWRLALAALWVLPVALLIVGVSKKAQNYFSRKQNMAQIAVQDGVQECLETVRDLKSNNAEKEYLDGLYQKIDTLEGRHMKSELGTAMFVVPAQMILKLGIATVALVGSTLLINGTLSLITFFMFLLVVSRIYEPMAFSLQNLAAMNSLQINIDRMNEIENYKEQDGKKEFHPKGYDIDFKNVGFAYNSGETVLRNVSFTAKQGEVTALIGPSGGGKSTAAKLAARFWDADKGEITVGGVDVKSVDPEQLLTAFSIVFQDVTLFNNTVMENIRIGRKDATDAEVMAAARMANCEEFVEKLPDKWNTGIGENGSALSGGERQRISIARAFLKDAPIILLDEATASLDVENETAIQSALSRLIKDKTVLLIAHRMRTVAGADKVVVLSDGTVAEQGQPEKLLSQNGIYSRMVKLQSESQNWTIG